MPYVTKGPISHVVKGMPYVTKGPISHVVKGMPYVTKGPISHVVKGMPYVTKGPYHMLSRECLMLCYACSQLITTPWRYWISAGTTSGDPAQWPSPMAYL